MQATGTECFYIANKKVAEEPIHTEEYTGQRTTLWKQTQAMGICRVN